MHDFILFEFQIFAGHKININKIEVKVPLHFLIYFILLAFRMNVDILFVAVSADKFQNWLEIL